MASNVVIEHVNCILNEGGLGDNIARLPALKYIFDNYKHISLHVWAPDYFVPVLKHFFPDQIIKSFSKAKKEYNPLIHGIKSSSDFHTPLRYHLVDHAFNLLVDKQVEDKDKNYLKFDIDKIDISKFTLPENYVILTTGWTAPVRAMPGETVNDLANYLSSSGYTPVYLGSKISKAGAGDDIIGKFDQVIDYSLGLDLINKTSILETGAIIARAKTIVGLDNGLLHVAGCTEVPIVGSFTNVDPKLRMPYRHDRLGYRYFPIVPPAPVGCNHCQSSCNFYYDHNFTRCFYPDKKCPESITTEMYIEQIEKALNVE